MKYYINKNGKLIGPGTVEEMRSLLACHFLLPTDLIRRDVETNWEPVSSLSEFGGPVGPEGSPLAAAEQTTPPSAEPQKIKVQVPAFSGTSFDPSATSAEAGFATDETAPASDEFGSAMGVGGADITRRTRIRLVQRITPTVYVSWALALSVIWTLGYFLAATYLEEEERNLRATATTSASGTTEAITEASEAGMSPKTPAWSSAAPARDPRLEFRYQPANRSFSPNPRPRTTVAAASLPEETQVFEAHLGSAESTSPSRAYSSDGPMEVRNLPFRNYDVAMVHKIRKTWVSILEQQDFTRGRTGRVVVEFRLHPNGQVTNAQVVKSELDDMLAWLCQKAVLEAGAYGTWPSTMRLQVPAGFRLIRFTFYYE